MSTKTRDGNKAKIKVFKDYIYDPKLSTYVELRKVYSAVVNFYLLELTTGEKYLIPANVSFRSTSGKKPVTVLKKGQDIYKEDGTTVRVNNIKLCTRTIPTRVIVPDMRRYVYQGFWCIGRSYT